MTTTETKQFTEVSIKMRLATSKDFNRTVVLLDPNRNPYEKILPKLGQPYWIQSQSTGRVDNRNYQISEDTDWVQFKDYLRREMIYVPASYFELLDAGE